MTDVNDLWHEYRQTQSQKVRQQLIEAHLPLVRYVAARMTGRLHSSVEMDDLMQSGCFGLMEAIDRYDPDRGIKFSTFANPRIQGAMMDSLRSGAWGSRRQRALHRLVKTAADDIQHELGRRATESEVAERLEVSLDEVRRAQTHFIASQVRSLDMPLLPEEPMSRVHSQSTADTIAAETAGDLPARIQELGERLAAKIARLPEKERLLLSWIYVEEMPRKQIAAMLGCGESRLSHLHTRAMVSLQAAMSGLDR